MLRFLFILIGLALVEAAIMADESALHTATGSVSGVLPLPKSPSPAVMAKRYEIVSRGGILSTIPPVGVVWLEGDFPPPEKRLSMEIVQEGFIFSPALLPIRVGTTVAFPNKDKEYHNVFSYSPTKRFDLGRYLPNEKPVPSEVFDKPGMVTLRCDIHQHMRAIILVIDSPYFVTTDTQGHFQLDGIPPGKYLLKGWLNSRKTLHREVEVLAGEDTKVDFRQNPDEE